MKLIRNAILTLSPNPNLEHKSIEVNGEYFKIECNYQASDDKSILFFITAEIHLQELPMINRDGSFEIPKKERIFLEKEIEDLSNYLSVIMGCKRGLSSPTPTIAFVSENDDDQKFLDNSKGINLPNICRYAGFKRNISLTDFPIKNILDRTEGFALLSESLSTTHANGRYRDLIRLFENAFNCDSGDKLTELLYSYLKDYNLGYTEQEISRWIKDRNPANHATKIRKKINYEYDVIKYIERMEQAAYYTLLNKKEWNNNSINKIKNWNADGVTTSETDLAIKRGSALTLVFTALDCFQSYPLNLNAFMTTPPNNWYLKNANKEDELPQQ